MKIYKVCEVGLLDSDTWLTKTKPDKEPYEEKDGYGVSEAFYVNEFDVSEEEHQLLVRLGVLMP